MKLDKALEVIKYEVEMAQELDVNSRTRSKVLDDGYVGCLLVLIPFGDGAMIFELDKEFFPDEQEPFSFNDTMYDARGTYELYATYEEALDMYERSDL